MSNKDCQKRYRQRRLLREPDFERKHSQLYREKYPERVMISHAKQRALKRNIEFQLSEKDIKIPQVCPVLGILLTIGSGRQQDSSPSLDRINPSIGYLPDNIRVISWRANKLKGDSTIEEMEKILEYMKNG